MLKINRELCSSESHVGYYKFITFIVICGPFLLFHKHHISLIMFSSSKLHVFSMNKSVIATLIAKNSHNTVILCKK